MILLSGGIDSPVAGKIMQERGMELLAIHFHTQPFTDEESVEKSRQLAGQLGLEKLFIVPFGEQSSDMVKKCDRRYYYLLTRRLMWRVAEEVARREGCEFLVTGENLGQVSSQTLDNMAVTDEATDMDVLRPLLGNDKQETIDLAKEFGTFETSKGPEVCNTLGPNNPVTRASLESVKKEEEKLDLEVLKEEALDEMEIVRLERVRT